MAKTKDERAQDRKPLLKKAEKAGKKANKQLDKAISMVRKASKTADAAHAAFLLAVRAAEDADDSKALAKARELEGRVEKWRSTLSECAYRFK